jgi:hypothetical protein
MAQLDDISMMLGKITSDLGHVTKWCEEHEERDEKRYDQLRSDIKSIAVPLAPLARVEGLEGQMADVIIVTAKWKKIAWMSRGFIAALVLLGGTAGGLATQLLKWF